MSLGDGIAIYAGVVGTVSLGWQIMRTRRADRPGINVTVANAMIGFTDGNAAWTVCVKAINLGEHPVGRPGRWTGLAGRLGPNVRTRPPAPARLDSQHR